VRGVENTQNLLSPQDFCNYQKIPLSTVYKYRIIPPHRLYSFRLRSIFIIMATRQESKMSTVSEMTVAERIKNFPLYVKHQIVTLKPPGEKPSNPIKCLMLLNWRQWQFFFLGLLGWTWVTSISFATSYHVSNIVLGCL